MTAVRRAWDVRRRVLRGPVTASNPELALARAGEEGARARGLLGRSSRASRAQYHPEQMVMHDSTTPMARPSQKQNKAHGSVCANFFSLLNAAGQPRVTPSPR